MAEIHNEDAPKKAIPVAETTEKGKLEQVKRDVDTETRKLAIEKGDPIAKMKLNLALAKQYPDHELATSIKGLGNYGDLTTSKEAAAAAVAKMIEIQKKLGISDVKLQDGIVGRGTLKASEGKEKNKEREEAQNLITELDQSLYAPDFQKKTEQARKEKPGVSNVLSTLWNKGGKEALNVAKNALKGTVVKDAKGVEYRVGKGTDGQAQYTNKDGEIFGIKNGKMELIKVDEKSDKKTETATSTAEKQEKKIQLTDAGGKAVDLKAGKITTIDGNDFFAQENGDIIAIRKDKVTKQKPNPQEYYQRLVDKDGKKVWETIQFDQIDNSVARNIFVQKYGDWKRDGYEYKNMTLKDVQYLTDFKNSDMVKKFGPKIIAEVDKIRDDLGYKGKNFSDGSDDPVAMMTLGQLQNALGSADNFVQSPLMDKVKLNWRENTFESRGFVDPNTYGVKSDSKFAKYTSGDDTIILRKNIGDNVSVDTYTVRNAENSYIPLQKYLENASSTEIDLIAKNLGGKNMPGKQIVQIGDKEISYKNTTRSS